MAQLNWNTNGRKHIILCVDTFNYNKFEKTQSMKDMLRSSGAEITIVALTKNNFSFSRRVSDEQINQLKEEIGAGYSFTLDQCDLDNKSSELSREFISHIENVISQA